MQVHEAKHEATRLGGDRVEIHQSIDGLMKVARRDQPRDYIWGRTSTHVLVRTANKRTGFSPTNYPTSGVIAFEFDAAPKHGRHSTGRRCTRRPLDSSLLDGWVLAKLGCSGIEVREYDIWRFTASVCSANTLDPGNLLSMMVTGFGMIVDADRFANAMLHGVPGSGPRCWGFGTLMIA